MMVYLRILAFVAAWCAAVICRSRDRAKGRC